MSTREGVIIECPLNDLFHDVLTVILKSQMGVSEMVVNVGNVVIVIYGIIHSMRADRHFSEKSRLLTVLYMKTVSGRDFTFFTAKRLKYFFIQKYLSQPHKKISNIQTFT